MEFNYSANAGTVPQSQQHAISQNEIVVPRTSSTGTSAVTDGTSNYLAGTAVPPEKAILHLRDDALLGSVTYKRPRTSCSTAVLLPGAARPEREHPRQRRRQQLDYATREEQVTCFCYLYVSRSSFIVIWAALVSSGWAKASAWRLEVSLCCDVLCQIVPLQYLSTSSRHREAGLHCRLFLYDIQLVIREVHLSSLRRLPDYIYDLIFVSSPNPDVCISVLVCDVEHRPTSFHFVLCGRKFVLSSARVLPVRPAMWCVAL